MTGKGIWHIIVAAGRGTRFGGDLPKQWLLLAGRPVVMHTIERFRNSTPDAEILVVINHDDLEYWKQLCEKFKFSSPPIIFGGKTRWESVKNAVDAIPSATSLYITVHDGARPLVSPRVINNVLEALKNGSDGAIPCVAITDSLRFKGDDEQSYPVDRNYYIAVQTPQGFKSELLKKAYSLPYNKVFTDDASVMDAAGFTDIKLVEGSQNNLKITLPRDLLLAEMIISQKWSD